MANGVPRRLAPTAARGSDRIAALPRHVTPPAWLRRETHCPASAGSGALQTRCRETRAARRPPRRGQAAASAGRGHGAAQTAASDSASPDQTWPAVPGRAPGPPQSYSRRRARSAQTARRSLVSPTTPTNCPARALDCPTARLPTVNSGLRRSHVVSASADVARQSQRHRAPPAQSSLTAVQRPSAAASLSGGQLPWPAPGPADRDQQQHQPPHGARVPIGRRRR